MAFIKKEDCIVYLDMDNVLVQFSTRENEEEQLKRMYNKGFYLGLSPSLGAFRVIEMLQYCGIRYKIISGLIDSPYVREEKIEWCHRYLMTREDNIILCPMDHRKVDYVGKIDSNMILVDDYPRYVDEWRDEGGVGILLDRKIEYSSFKRINKLIDFLLVLIHLVELEYDERMCILDMYYDLKDEYDRLRRKSDVCKECNRDKGGKFHRIVSGFTRGRLNGR